MKTPRLLTLAFVLFAALAGLAPRAAQADVSFSYFYDSLDPYGDWVDVDGYGYCWHPEGVGDDWAPYTDGYWSYTDAGWTWVSYEDFGSICYHYGRWVRIEGEGWCWVPDNQWGPAWVSWRHSEDRVGWAPLPPEAHFRRDVGFSVWVDTSYDIGPSYYNFCDYRDFGAPVLTSVIYPRSRNVVFIENSVNITNISFNTGSNFVYCGGPQYDYISTRSAHRVPTLKLVQNTTIVNNTVINNFNGDRAARRAANALPRNVQRGNALEVFAPAVAARPSANAARPAKISKVVASDKINKGWAGMKDPEARKGLKQKLAQQTNGLTPENTPAKAVQFADLKPVPEKADLTAVSPAATGKVRPGKRGEPLVAEPVNPAGEAAQAGVRGKGKQGRPGEVSATENPTQPAAAADPVKPGKGDGRMGKNGKPERAQQPAVAAEPVTAPDANPPSVLGKGKHKTAADAVGLPQPVVETPDANDRRRDAVTDVGGKNSEAMKERNKQAAEQTAGEREAAKTQAAEQAVTARQAAKVQAAEQAAGEREATRARAAEKMRSSEAAAQAAAANRREKLQAAEAEQARSRMEMHQHEQALKESKQAARESQAAESQRAQQRDSAAMESRRAAQDQARQEAARQQQQADGQREARAAQMQQQRAVENQRAVQQQRAADSQQQKRASENQRATAQARAEAMQQQRAQQQQQQQVQQQQQRRAEPQRVPQQQQQQRQPQQQVTSGQGQGKGNGKRGMTPEEAAALQRR